MKRKILLNNCARSVHKLYTGRPKMIETLSFIFHFLELRKQCKLENPSITHFNLYTDPVFSSQFSFVTDTTISVQID